MSTEHHNTAKIRVFISSVQAELHNERKAARVPLSGDPALGPHCVPVTYEDEPASSAKALEECISLIDECQIFVLLVWKEQGHMLDQLSITHREYLRPQHPVPNRHRAAQRTAIENDGTPRLRRDPHQPPLRGELRRHSPDHQYRFRHPDQTQNRHPRRQWPIHRIRLLRWEIIVKPDDLNRQVAHFLGSMESSGNRQIKFPNRQIFHPLHYRKL